MQHFRISLPDEMAEKLRAKVESGIYASESDVVRDGLCALEVHEKTIEEWLYERVTPVRDALRADLARAMKEEPAPIRFEAAS